MKRNIPVRFFKGLEIEATKHFLLPTLIAPGQYDYDACASMMAAHDIEHILLGYMYDPAGCPLTIDLERAFMLANRMMREGKRVTIEVRPDQVTDEFVARCPEPVDAFADLFVVLVGIYFPEMKKIGSYTTLKLHSEFCSTNNGVWCMSACEFAGRGRFTPWEAYAMDEWLS